MSCPISKGKPGVGKNYEPDEVISKRLRNGNFREKYQALVLKNV